MHRRTMAWLILGLSACSGEPKPNTGDDSETEDTGEAVVVAPPSELLAHAPFGQRVDLEWVDESRGEDGYLVSRTCTGLLADDDGFCELASLPPDSSSYRDSHVESGLAYTYRVQAVGGTVVAEARVDAETPPAVETAIVPRPQGAWALGEPMAMPSRVHIDTNVPVDALGVLLDTDSRHSLPSRLQAAGVESSFEATTGAPEEGVLELYLYRLEGEDFTAVSENLVRFEEMGDEGSVILVEPSGDGLRMIIAAQTDEGLYRGGLSAMQLLLTDELTTAASELQHQILLDHPDHPVRSAYDSSIDLRVPDDGELSPELLDQLDALSRSGANLLFVMGFAHAPMKDISWKPWDETAAWLDAVRAAADERFIELVMEAGKTSGSASQHPEAYAFVDGVAIHEEPFELLETDHGEWEAAPLNPVSQLIPDPEMSDPNAWTNNTTEGCHFWSYDPDVGHNEPGSWRLDADGDGACGQLKIWLDGEDVIDGQYLLTARFRSAEEDEHLGPYTGSTGQVTLVVRWDDGTSLALPERSIAIRPDISTLNPSKSNHDGSEWFEVYTTLTLDSGGREVDEVYLYARSASGVGTFWMDELSFERIDGSLRNIAGGVAPPVVTSSDGSVLFEEGVDYTVCQVGEDSGVPTEICSSDDDDANYETVYWVNSPSGTLNYGFEPRFSRDLNPFVIRWLDGGRWPDGDTILVTYDINLPYQGQYGYSGIEHIAQRINYCAIDSVFDELGYGQAYDKVMGDGEGQLGAVHLRIDLSEVRGVNRSHLCHEQVETDGALSWQPSASNGARFAEVAAKLIDAAHERSDEATLYLWDDMLNPMYNGGNEGYQAKYGGPNGASACALTLDAPPRICEGVDDVVPIDPDAVMIHWSYKVGAIRATAATAVYYDAIERPWLIGTGGDQQVSEDWAAIARSSSATLGVSAFVFDDHDIPFSLQTFWNHDWALRYLVDFETDASSVFQMEPPDFTVTAGTGTASADGSCGAWSSETSNNWEGNNEGGLCVDEGSALAGAVDEVPATPGRAYRAGLHVTWADEASTVEVRFVWRSSDGTEEDGDWMTAEEVVSLKDSFVRYETSSEGVVAPDDVVGVRLEVSLPSGAVALDNLLLWESTPPCFDDCD